MNAKFVIVVLAIIMLAASVSAMIPPKLDIPVMDFPENVPSEMINAAFPNSMFGVSGNMLTTHSENDALSKLKNNPVKLEVFASRLGIGPALVAIGYCPEAVLITTDFKGRHAWIATDRPGFALHEVLVEGLSVKFGRSINISANETDTSVTAMSYASGKEVAFSQKTEYELSRALESVYDNQTFVAGFYGRSYAVNESEFQNFCDDNKDVIVAIKKELGFIDSDDIGGLLKVLGLPGGILLGYTDGQTPHLGVGIDEGNGILKLQEVEIGSEGIERSTFARMTFGGFKLLSILESRQSYDEDGNRDRKYGNGWTV